MKKCIVSLYVIICLGIFLFAGCASADTNDKTNKEKKAPAGEDAFANANDMFKSADLCGTVNGCSDTGCTIAPLPFSSIEDDGTSSSEVMTLFIRMKPYFKKQESILMETPIL